MPDQSSNIADYILGVDDSLSTSSLGLDVSNISSGLDADQAESATEVSNRPSNGATEEIVGYDLKPGRVESKWNDYQIGSVRLTVPPRQVNVHRIRDVGSVPIMRGQSVAARSGQGVVAISMSLEFPDVQAINSELVPMIAELKTTPFTVIKSKDLIDKVSQQNLSDTTEEQQRAVRLVRNFEHYEDRFRRLVAQFLVTRNELGAFISIRGWQTHLITISDEIVEDIKQRPLYYQATKDQDGEIESYSSEAENAYSRIRSKILGSDSADDVDERETLFGDRLWQSWNEVLDSDVFKKRVLDAISNMASVKLARDRLNKQIFDKSPEPTVPDTQYLPVAFSNMTLNTIPGKPGMLRADMQFELFHHHFYINNFLYHSYNGSRWTTTEDPAEADLLMRWRDAQFLDGASNAARAGSSLGIIADSPPKEIIKELNKIEEDSGGDRIIRNKYPRYIDLMRDAWKYRVCKRVPYKPTDHTLSLFYPENTAQISTTDSMTAGGVYRMLELDSGSPSGIASQIRVNWTVNLSRQIDEFTGLVKHQWAGGSTLSAEIEVILPTGGPFAGSEPSQLHKKKVRGLNHMFNQIEQNRKVQPSDAFMPTTIFATNPILQMFGAYCFELGDFPLVQSDVGKAITSIKLVEAIPILGMGNAESSETPKNRRDRLNGREDINFHGLLKKMAAVAATGINPTTHSDNAAKRVTSNWIAKTSRSITSITLPEVLKEYVLPIKTLTDAEAELVASHYLDYWNTFWSQENNPVDRFLEQARERFIGTDIGYVLGFDHIMMSMALLYIYDPAAWEELKPEEPSPYYARILLPGPGLSSLELENPLRLAWNFINGYNISTTIPRDRSIGNRLTSAGYVSSNTTFSDRFDNIYSRFVGYNVSADAKRSTLRKVYTRALTSARDVTSVSDFQNALQELGVSISITDLLGFDDTRVDLLSDYTQFGAQTRQLYPDMVLPTYREILNLKNGVSPNTDLLKRFVPTYGEIGKLNPNMNAGQDYISRSLDDLVDPDVFWVRERQDLPDIEPLSSVYDENPDSKVIEGGEVPNDRDNTVAAEIADRESRLDNEIQTRGSKKTPAAYSIQSLGLEQALEPNTRRMLYAFPTYSLEFFLEGSDEVGSLISDQRIKSYEARLLNILPVIEIGCVEDKVIPNFAEVTFIGRRSGLHNDSWQWLPPKRPIDNDRFTNLPEKVKDHLDEFSRISGDSYFITSNVLSEGSRVSVRVGYGTDLSNERMLPVKIAGTISEVSLGEVSKMVIQSIGTQIINPISANLGGGGRWNPLNRQLTGKYTMRAFTDIFQHLDTELMGSSRKGIEADVSGMTNQEIHRIWQLGQDTRSTTDWLGDFFSGFESDILGWLPLLPENTHKTLDSDIKRFFPELINIHPTFTGLSDWIMSNTDARGEGAAFWVDMISRINPGTIWWPHTYGDEVRLFYGKPDQVFKADPIPANPKLAGALMALVRSERESHEDSIDEEIENVISEGLAQDDVVTGIPFIARGSPAGQVPDLIREIRSTYGDRVSGRIFRSIMLGVANSIVKEQERIGNLDEWEEGYSGEVNWDVYPARKGRELMQDDDAFRFAFGGLERFALVVQNASDFLNANLGEETEFDAFMIQTGINAESTGLLSPDTFNQDHARFMQMALNRTVHTLRAFAGRPTDNRIIRRQRALLQERLDEVGSDISRTTDRLVRLQRLLGYRRFRNYHLAVSGKNIISNRTIASQAKMYNQVIVDGVQVGYSVLPYERRAKDIQHDLSKLNWGIFEWFKGALSESDRDRALGILFPNALAKGLAKMYDGELILQGNPWIKPHDIIYTLDLHNGVYGPVKACRVITTLNQTNGLVTRVVPEMYTQSFSSTVLSDHMVMQRQMRAAAVGTLLLGITAAVAAPTGGGILIGGALALGAASFNAYANVMDKVGRMRLSNFSAAEALADAGSERETARVMEAMILDNIVPSSNINIINPVSQSNSRYIQRMNQPELGVSAFPLMRLGTQVPVVAGLKSNGLINIPSGLAAPVQEATTQIRDGLEAFAMLWNGKLRDFNTGVSFIEHGIRREIQRTEDAKRVLRERGAPID